MSHLFGLKRKIVRVWRTRKIAIGANRILDSCTLVTWKAMNVTQIATRNSGHSAAIIYLEGYLLVELYGTIDYLGNSNTNATVDFVLQCARDIKLCSSCLSLCYIGLVGNVALQFLDLWDEKR